MAFKAPYEHIWNDNSGSCFSWVYVTIADFCTLFFLETGNIKNKSTPFVKFVAKAVVDQQQRFGDQNISDSKNDWYHQQFFDNHFDLHSICRAIILQIKLKNT